MKKDKKPKCKVDWKPRRAYRFEDWEIQYIKDNWTTMTGYEIAEHLHRNASSVYQKGWAIFGRGKKPVIREKKCNNGFKKGHIPWNKGKKTGELPKTAWKKGNIPWHTKPIGAISYRQSGRKYPYYYIKTAPNKWELLHHVVWRKHHGEIPKGHIIRFKDGNTKNTDISNLYIVSKAEHMKMNLNREKASKTSAIKKEGGFLNMILNGYNYE